MDGYHSIPRVLLVTFPGQGHINPSLQFSKRLVRMGIQVTLATALSAFNCMTKTTTTQGLTVVGFSDGYDNGWQDTDDIERVAYMVRRRSSEAVADLITSSSNQGQPFTCVIYTMMFPWIGRVARTLHVPSTFLWIQPAAVLDIYFYYFNGYEEAITNNWNDPSWSIELPGLPRLAPRDLPSFLNASDLYYRSLSSFKEHLEVLDEETNPKVLVNTFDALEFEALKAIKKLNLISVGPLIPSAFLDGKHQSDTSFGGDLFQKSKDYTDWLNSKPERSVVYVSFGSLSTLSKQQMEEIAHGLIESGRPFLWVIRPTQKGWIKAEDKLSCEEKVERQGMVVPWCAQLEVLSHPSLGCFVTHCGWNSSLESLVSGIPVVAFPLWSDQRTNAKLIEDVWRIGVRVMANEEGIVEGNEIKRCVEVVMEGGERGEEIRRNVNKWKEVTKEAAKEGGSSDLNLRTFVDELRDISVD
ncbi:crocetin glucosyltransferase, chloroplastic-like [Actinidia eriantha]|uniref:crocetin glucosyltransferase, chloroplastic-like n=1 Tax=Actinidia eriantha TaxID=165200 RepID=UPI0025874AE2|nr:crocetin glucosyltransferase, chloroplastic-like [Actinidia eriantha]